MVLNTQGWVLSPSLFSIYTNKKFCNIDNLMLIMYADDIALVRCDKYIVWMEESSVQLNVKRMCYEDSNADVFKLLLRILNICTQ